MKCHIMVNYKHLKYCAAGTISDVSKTLGVMDLGGGSTQITFVPSEKATIDSAPTDYISKVDILGKEYSLYTHRYVSLSVNIMINYCSLVYGLKRPLAN